MFSGAAYSQIISRSVLTLGAQGIFVEGVVQQPHSEGRRRAVTRKRSSKQALLIDFLGDLAQASSPPHASVSSAGKLGFESTRAIKIFHPTSIFLPRLSICSCITEFRHKLIMAIIKILCKAT
ncbi:uncharacterized protein LOC144328012 isoform X3 [Podarcis muralis]